MPSLYLCSKCRSLYETPTDVEGTLTCRVKSCRHGLMPAHKDARIFWVRSIIDSHEE